MAGIFFFLYYGIYLGELSHLQFKAKKLSYPIQNSNTSLTELSTAIMLAAMHSDEDVYLFKSNGEIYTASNICTDHDFAIAKQALSGTRPFENGLIDAFIYGRIYYCYDIPHHLSPFQTVVLSSNAAVIAFARRSLIILIASLLLYAVVLFFIMRYLSNLIVNRFCDISNVAITMANGNYEARIEPHGWAEFRELSGNLNCLSQTIKENIASLERQNDIIGAARDREATFSANIAHELRSPLTGIMLNAEAIKYYVATLDDARKRSDNICYESLRLDKICEHLLLLAKLENSDFAKRISKKETKLLPLLEEIADAKRLMHQDKHLEISCSGETGCTIVTESSLLRQSVENLVENACKYSPQGAKIIISCRKESESAIIEITDNGFGIAETDLHNIFDRFYRAEKSKKKNSVGTGLGLAITQQLILALNGEISVTSAVNTGTTVRITLRPDNKT